MPWDSIDEQTGRPYPEGADKPDAEWSCTLDGKVFTGETREVKSPSVVWDTWFSEGKQVHTHYQTPLSSSDSNYDTNDKGEPRMVSGRAKTPDGEFYAFTAKYGNEDTEFSYIKKREGTTLKAHLKDGNSLEIPPLSSEYESVINQMNKINFDPPCRKPF